ncbi:hypothetical protein MLD38_038539 [Melastoma candidum]|uniref:Uncharacterized protein n=1 Tax=Melastoma candidum TaxID=119954 RepID=A0ACB9KZU0_9MYRT|nr:hypothetical protein MLD38_038539 [Melastoma candidum]
MLLQPSLRHHGSLAPPPQLQPRVHHPGSLEFPSFVVTCSSSTSNRSRFRRHKDTGFGKQPRQTVNWNSVYRKIWLATDMHGDSAAGAEVGAMPGTVAVLNQCKDQGKHFTKWELFMVVKELRKTKRFKEALEVLDWMNNHDHRFRLSSSDAAIQLDLVAKVYGMSTAEDFFLKLSDKLKDGRVYGALLNCYTHGRMKDKAESLMNEMRDKGYASHALPFNVMMTLYMNLGDYDMVEQLVSEMMQKNVQLDAYSYNIWLSSRGSLDSVEKVEEVFEQMKLDQNITLNWTTFSTLATLYIKMGVTTKAEECLKEIETVISRRDRVAYHYLISLYGTLGNKEETYRIWNSYNAVFPTIPNLGYHAMISSLVRIGDIEGAEKVYEEWLSVRTSFDSRLGNLLMGFHVKEGNMQKAETIFNQMIEQGGRPNSMTWETLAEGHIAERRISEAFSCYEKAFSVEGSKSWKPKPTNLTSYFQLCQEEGDSSKEEALMGLLRRSGCLNDQLFASLAGLSSTSPNISENDQDSQILGSNDEADSGGELPMEQLQSSAI